MLEPDRLKTLLEVVESVRRRGWGDLSPHTLGTLLGLAEPGSSGDLPSESDVARSLVRELTRDFDLLIAPVGETPGPGTLDRYLSGSVPDDAAPPRQQTEPKATALMLLILLSPDALDEARAVFTRWQQVLADATGDPVTAHVLRAVLDGWWFAEAFGLAAPEAALRPQVREYVDRLVTRARTEQR